MLPAAGKPKCCSTPTLPHKDEVSNDGVGSTCLFCKHWVARELGEVQEF